MSTNRKLEDLFGLTPAESESISETPQIIEEEQQVNAALLESRSALAEISSALPAVRELAAVDQELDAIATKAMSSFEELSDLGMQSDPRFASEIFSVAASMLGHALSAKTAKANRKLKTIEMQMKKVRLDMDVAKQTGTNESGLIPGAIEQAEGKILSRNELMEQLMGPRAATREK